MPDTAFVDGKQQTMADARAVENEATVRERHRGGQMGEASRVPPRDERHRNVVAAARGPFTHAGEGIERIVKTRKNKGDFVPAAFAAAMTCSSA